MLKSAQVLAMRRAREVLRGMDKAGVVLLDGAISGAALLAQLAAGGEMLQALFIDLGQLGAAQRLSAAGRQCEPLGIELVRLDLGSLGPVFRNVQNRRLSSPVPLRHLIGLSLGLSYAHNLGSARLYLPAGREDAQSFADASLAFLAQFRLLGGLLSAVALATPFIDLTDADILQRAIALGLDPAQAYACRVGQPVQCGRCAGCQRWRAAFQAAGLEEPADVFRT
jgi:7-cyano-7-deazaguanine synthase